MDDTTFHAGGTPRVLTWDPTVATRGLDDSTPSIGNHLDAGGRQLELLRDAIAIAKLANRTLAVPRFTCFCDKVWGGHDNIFNFDCHYPGSKDSGHIPGPCPMDHFISPTKLREAGVKFVALEELRRAPYEFGGDGSVTVTMASARCPWSLKRVRAGPPASRARLFPPAQIRRRLKTFWQR